MSPDYIRGKRDGLARGRQIAQHFARDSGSALEVAHSITAEAAKLPEADGALTYWQQLEMMADLSVWQTRATAAEAALAAMTERVRVLEEGLDLEERHLFEAVENQDDEDGPGIMPSDIEGAFHRIRTGQSASVKADAKLPEADGIAYAEAVAQIHKYSARAWAAESALAAMTERCRVLEEALRPFADQAAEYSLSGDGPIHRWIRLKVGDLRRAAAVLTEKDASV